MLRLLYLVSLSVWVGSITFFSFGVAPSVFRALPKQQAGDAVGAIFPTYYVFGAVAGALVLLLGALIWRAQSDRRWRSVHAALVVLMLAATLVAGLVIQPRATQLRLELRGDAPAAQAKADFDRLHQWAVWLNGGVLLGGLVLIGGFSRRLERRRP